MAKAGAFDRLKRTVKRSRVGVISGRIGAERVRDLRRVMGRKENPMGATHRGLALEDSLDDIDAVFADYERYAGLTGEAIAGKTILELDRATRSEQPSGLSPQGLRRSLRPIALSRSETQASSARSTRES